MSERRRHTRYAVNDVRGVLHFSSEARILNMSLAGAAVETSTPMRLDRSYMITVRSRDGQELRLNGKVVRCRLRSLVPIESGEKIPVYEAGIRFEDTISGASEEILRFLERSAVVEVGQRVVGRFRLAGEHSATLDTDFQFVVKTISVTGMLIETEIAHQVGALFDYEVALRGQPLRARGRVAFSQELGRPGRPAIASLGVEFVGLEAGTRRAIEEFIARELAPPEGDGAPS